MFHHGEFEIFQSAGFGQVFYGDTLIGARMPNLTYMLSFADMNDLNAKWDVFRNDPRGRSLRLRHVTPTKRLSVTSRT